MYLHGRGRDELASESERPGHGGPVCRLHAVWFQAGSAGGKQARFWVASQPLQSCPPSCTYAEPGGNLSARQSASLPQVWQLTLASKLNSVPQNGALPVVTRQAAN